MDIPQEIQLALNILNQNDYEAYIVGGCVRDLLRNIEPNDWDLTTNAKPEQIQEIFGLAGYKTFYENDFGTVTALLPKAENPSEEMAVEITPFRAESKYSDKRHPDEIRFVKTLDEDLARRDFTINAISLGIKNQELRIKNGTMKNKKNHNSLFIIHNSDFQIIDLFKGQEDLKNKIIRAVGEPSERFSEDGLRMMRAVRLAVCLDKKPWKIELATKKAIAQNANLLKFIAKERIRDELIKIIQSPNGDEGIELLRELNLLPHIIPELLEGIDMEQSKHHIYQIYQHNVLSLRYACEKDFSFEVRLSALLHDIAKPRTKNGQGENATFYGHEIVGAKMAKKILEKLRFPRKEIDRITKLIRYHLFYYNTGEVSESSVRRLLRNVGPELINELLQVRMADRIGSGVPKAEPYKLRHLKYLLEKVAKDPLSAKMLKVNGQDIMRELKVKPSVKIGQVLSILLSYVLSDPTKNNKEFLIGQIQQLGKLSDAELAKIAKIAQAEVEKVDTKQDQMTKAKYWVS